MKVILSCTLYLFSIISTVFSGCTKEILPELTFGISGNNIKWPCQSTKNIFTTGGRYIPRNIIATRMQIFRDEAILALPRYKPGVPFTLGVVHLDKKACGTITPFPCWALQEEGNCDALQNVVDIHLDVQDVLWVLDTGIVNTITEHPVRRCSPKVMAINVKTGKIVKKIDLSNLVASASRLQNILVDYAQGGKVFLYISDAPERTIIVYDVINDKGFLVKLPKAVSLGTGRSDVLYMSLVRKTDGTKVVYFTYLGSSRVFSIKADKLREGSSSKSVVNVGTKPGKIVFLGSDNGNKLFLRKKDESDVYMWSTETDFKSDNFILVQKGNECRLPTHVVPGHRKLMWTLESNFHDYITNTIPCYGASISIHPLLKQCD